jgi:sec-independent protein translocase protein TatA
MPNIGPLELAIVLIIALVVFGPKRLPELGRSLGKGIREFRGSVSGEGHDEPERPEAIEPPHAPAPPPKPPVVKGAEEGETVAHDHP